MDAPKYFDFQCFIILVNFHCSGDVGTFIDVWETEEVR